MESEESFVQEMDERKSFIGGMLNDELANWQGRRRNLWRVSTVALSFLCILLGGYAAILRASLTERKSSFATGYDTELGIP